MVPTAMAKPLRPRLRQRLALVLNPLPSRWPTFPQTVSCRPPVIPLVILLKESLKESPNPGHPPVKHLLTPATALAPGQAFPSSDTKSSPPRRQARSPKWGRLVLVSVAGLVGVGVLGVCHHASIRVGIWAVCRA